MSAEDLLVHRRRIERTARALVYGDVDAEDLVQDGWVAVLERPPGAKVRNLRGWLRSFLRFKAIDAARRNAVRRRHEERAARSEAGASDPMDVVVRAETLERLARAVLALDEPYRSTVLLRYFDDLPARVIAERQGIPVETVRTRLKRATARLREQLDQDHGGDRRAWCLALLAVIGRPGGRTGGGRIAATMAAGGLLMGVKTKLGVITLLLLIAGGTLLLTRSGTVTRSPPEVPAAMSDAEPLQVFAVQPGATPRPPRPGGEMTVEVRGSEGEPLAGAAVVVGPAREGAVAARWAAAPIFATGATDGSGRAVLPLAGDALAQVRQVEVTLAGYARAVVRTAGRDVRVRMERAAVLRGAVREASSGRPLQEIPVVAKRTDPTAPEWTDRCVTQEDGRYEMTALPAGTFKVASASPLWSDVEIGDVLLEAGETRTLDLWLAPGFEMTGKVLQAGTGAPVEAGRIGFRTSPGTAIDPDAVQWADLGPRGEFRLRGLPEWVSTSRNFEIEADGYVESLTVKTPPAYDMNGFQTRNAVLEATPATVLEGRVLDPAGRGVPDARVLIGTGPEFLSMVGLLDLEGPSLARRNRVREARTGPDGGFRTNSGPLLTGQDDGMTATLLVVPPDWGVVRRSLTAGELRRPIEVHLGPGVSLDVEVAGPDGRPEADASVRVVLRAERPFEVAGANPFAAFEGPRVTDAKGHVTFSHLCPGTFEIRASSADGRRAAAHAVEIEGAGPLRCRIALEEGPVVSGTVVNEADRAPLPGAIVLLDGGPGIAPRRGVADAEGRFEFPCAERYPHFSFSLRVLDVPGQGVWFSKSVEAQAGQPIELPARCWVQSTRRIRGRVLDATTGRPVPKGLIKCSWRDPKEPDVEQGGMDRWFHHGEYDRPIPVVEGLRLTFWADGYESVKVPVEELERQGYEVRLAPKDAASRCRLRLRITGGEGSAPAWIRVYDAQTKRPRSLWSWAGGSLPEIVLDERDLGGPGRVLLEVQVPGWYQPAPAEVTVEPGREVEVPVEILEGGGTLAGWTDAKAGSVVTVTYPSGITRGVGVDERGRFWVGWVAPGIYEISRPGGSPASVTVTDGAKLDVDLR
jgi:RNA polymerase sigma factor (sigma-70 family)